MAATPDTSQAKPTDARALTVVVVLGAWAIAVLLLVVYLDRRGQPSASNSLEATAPVTRSFPAPPAGAVVFSREAGQNALALGVVPGARRVRVQASVVGPDAVGVSGLATTFSIDGATASGTACGPGCYRADLRPRGEPRSVEVSTEGSLTTRWRVVLPAPWPPENASAMVTQSRRVWRALRSVSFTDRLASDPRHVVVSTWRTQAPDRLAYDIVKGYSAVVIGKHRWDKAPGGHWKRSPQSPITQPTPPWESATNAHVLGATRVGGRRGLQVSFYDPQTPGWYTVALEPKSLRTLDLRMVTTAHFMHEVYGEFDAAPAIRVPRR